MDHLHAKTGCLYIIGSLVRVGTLTFATRLEHECYPPDTEDNELYNIFQIQYCGMPHYIIEIPSSGYKVALTIATQCSLNLVSGKPSSVCSTDPPFGLLCGAEQCFTLETIHNDKLDWAQQLKDEQRRVQDYLKIISIDIGNE